MKRYDLVVFGSTFLAAGVIRGFLGDVLIIEPQTKPGYEFIDSFHPGNMIEYASSIIEDDFVKYLNANGLLDDGYILRWTPYVADWFLKSDATYLFLTEITDVTECDGGYIVTIFNSMGKSEIFAKRIVDTRTKDYSHKTINILTKGSVGEIKSDGTEKLLSYRDYSVYQIMLSDGDDYPTARKKAVEGFGHLEEAHDNIRLVAIADKIYKKASFEIKRLSDNYFISPSAYYDNPIQAHYMGVRLGGKI